MNVVIWRKSSYLKHIIPGEVTDGGKLELDDKVLCPCDWTAEVEADRDSIMSFSDVVIPEIPEKIL